MGGNNVAKKNWATAQFFVYKYNMKFLLGKKIEMSQMFDEKGNITPVTLVEAGPCIVLQKKSKEKEGYDALQVGYLKIEKKNKIKKTMKGKEYKHIKEIRDLSELNVGDEINTSIFQEDMVSTEEMLLMEQSTKQELLVQPDKDFPST